MKWNNNEMSFFLREDNIIFIEVDKDVKKLTVPAAKECVEKLKEAINVDENPKVLFFLCLKFMCQKKSLDATQIRFLEKWE